MGVKSIIDNMNEMLDHSCLNGSVDEVEVLIRS